MNKHIIAGMQSTTLVDYPDRVASILFCQGCDMRCPYCHNRSLLNYVESDCMRTSAVMGLLSARSNLIDGVVISGGEPLVHDCIPELIREIRARTRDDMLIKLDTNGQHPERLRELIDDGLVDYVAMDFKTAPERYDELGGNGDLTVRSALLLNSSNVEHEFRMTCVSDFVSVADIQKVSLITGRHHPLYLQTYVPPSPKLTYRGYTDETMRAVAEMCNEAGSRVLVR
jgi:pyruvate formate lyase activating enzyme